MKRKMTVHCCSFVVRALALSLLGWTLVCQLPAADNAGSERWQGAIAAFEAADKASPPPQDAILFIGSSTIVRWKTLAQDFPEHPVINRGFGGSQIADSVFYADRIVIPYRPRLIVLRAGGNDIHAGKSPEQVADDFQAFVARVRAKLPEVRIAYMPINASPLRWANVEREKQANELIKAYIAAGKNLDYIDAFEATLGADGKPREDLFVKDRLHFNDEGYKILDVHRAEASAAAGRKGRPA
jgi:lysophospholipase L1-like esterase